MDKNYDQYDYQIMSHATKYNFQTWYIAEKSGLFDFPRKKYEKDETSIYVQFFNKQPETKKIIFIDTISC